MKYRQEIKQKIIAGRQTRTVYKYKTHYRKYWNHRDTKNCSVMAMPINQHIDIVNNFFPEYIIGSKVLKKSMWIDYNTLPGISANKFEHTEEFIKKIKNFCIDNINFYTWTISIVASFIKRIRSFTFVTSMSR